MSSKEMDFNAKSRLWVDRCDKEELELCNDIQRRKDYHNRMAVSTIGTILVPVNAGHSKNKKERSKVPEAPVVATRPKKREEPHSMKDLLAQKYVGRAPSVVESERSLKSRQSGPGSVKGSMKGSVKAEDYPRSPRFSQASSAINTEVVRRLEALENAVLEEKRKRHEAEMKLLSLTAELAREPKSES